jgi:hypothetical protein
MERPDWMKGEEEGKFIKRIVALYEWYGEDVEDVNRALKKLFGRSGDDLEIGISGLLTFIKKKERKTNFMKMIRSTTRSAASKMSGSRVQPALAVEAGAID